MLKPNFKNNQSGSVIIFTVLILGSMLAITLALTAIYLPRIRAVGDASNGSVGAIYAADSAIEWCLYTSRGNPPLPSPTMFNGSTYAIQNPLTAAPDNCTASNSISIQAVGTYHSVSRSLQVNTP
jgi:hypothetical protein